MSLSCSKFVQKKALFIEKDENLFSQNFRKKGADCRHIGNDQQYGKRNQNISQQMLTQNIGDLLSRNAGCHILCYPQLVGTIQLSGGRRHVKKYIWSF